MRLPRVRLTVRTLMLLTLLAALQSWLYVRAVRQEVAHARNSNPPVVLLDILVLDAATGQPVWGAKVDWPLLRPAWRDRREMKIGDLRREHSPPGWRSSPHMTDGGGRAQTALKAQRNRRIEYRVQGLLPVAGQPEVVFHPLDGLRVEADGYETWVKFLNDIAPDDGRRLGNMIPMRRLGNMIPMPITIRLKPVDRRTSPDPGT